MIEDRSSSPTRDAHLHLSQVGQQAADRVIVRLAVERSGWLAGALLSSAGTSLVLLVTLSLVTALQDGSAPASVLFALNGVGTALATRYEEHPLRAWLLRGARRLLLLSALVSFGAAGALVLPLDPEVLRGLWSAFVAASLLATVGIMGTWQLAVPARTAPR